MGTGSLTKTNKRRLMGQPFQVEQCKENNDDRILFVLARLQGMNRKVASPM